MTYISIFIAQWLKLMTSIDLSLLRWNFLEQPAEKVIYGRRSSEKTP